MRLGKCAEVLTREVWAKTRGPAMIPVFPPVALRTNANWPKLKWDDNPARLATMEIAGDDLAVVPKLDLSQRLCRV